MRRFVAKQFGFYLIGAALALSGCNSTPPTPQGILTITDASICDRSIIWSDDRGRVLRKADAYLTAEPRTVTADISPRSAGGPNDFYSEGDYWWPVPEQAEAPYERRDGQSNPDNFVAHRLAMIRLSDIQGSLTSAYLLTSDVRYAGAAARHLRAWFITPETRMSPSLLYAQAIKGRHTGRSIGLIDTLHLVETAKSAKILGEAGLLSPSDFAAIKSWFSEYSLWMNTHPYGIKERDWHNNHSIAWGLQMAAFADLTEDQAMSELVRNRFKTEYLAKQMVSDGSFPNELGRTKPYGYSLFVIDLMAGIAQISSTPEDNLWTYKTEDGKSLKNGLNYIAPYIKDKSMWPHAKDVAYWDDWPVRHSSQVFAGHALKDCSYYEAVRNLPTDSHVYEVTRNFPLRHPVIWMDR